MPKLDVIFEDNHLLVLNKPAGLLTQASGTDQPNLEDLAKAWIKEKYSKPGNVYLHAVHRLDRPVSGLVIFAKTSKALSRLNAAMRERLGEKIYLAWVEALPSKKQARLQHHWSHGSHIAYVKERPFKESRPVSLSYEVVDEAEKRLRVNLETGRYHQIRAQLSLIGCPIVGDTKYGASRPCKGGVIRLHHSCLKMPHPVSAEMMEFRAEPC